MTTSGQQTTASIGQPATSRFQSYPRWPVALLAAAAYVAIWGGWVELGRMSGFGPVKLLPGITDLEVDLSITLPLGMEVYAAYAMGAWLTKKHIDPSARSFAKWSTFASLAIGMSGQIAYHLLAAAGIQKAPVPVVVGVACVSVIVLGMASMLAHRLHVPTGHHMADIEPPVPMNVDPTGEPDTQSLTDSLDNHHPDVADRAGEATDRPTDRKRRPVSDEERSTIIRLSQHMSERAIARQVKRSRDTVRRVLEEADTSEPAVPEAEVNEPAGATSDAPQPWPISAVA